MKGEVNPRSVDLLNSNIIKQVSLGSYFKTLESYQWNLVYPIWYFCLEYLGFSIGPFHSFENYKEIYAQLSKISLLEIRSRPKLAET